LAAVFESAVLGSGLTGVVLFFFEAVGDDFTGVVIFFFSTGFFAVDFDLAGAGFGVVLAAEAAFFFEAPNNLLLLPRSCPIAPIDKKAKIKTNNKYPTTLAIKPLRTTYYLRPV
jgi:hypothetical protein